MEEERWSQFFAEAGIEGGTDVGAQESCPAERLQSQRSEARGARRKETTASMKGQSASKASAGASPAPGGGGSRQTTLLDAQRRHAPVNLESVLTRLREGDEERPSSGPFLLGELDGIDVSKYMRDDDDDVWESRDVGEESQAAVALRDVFMGLNATPAQEEVPGVAVDFGTVGEERAVVPIADEPMRMGLQKAQEPMKFKGDRPSKEAKPQTQHCGKLCEERGIEWRRQGGKGRNAKFSASREPAEDRRCKGTTVLSVAASPPRQDPRRRRRPAAGSSRSGRRCSRGRSSCRTSCLPVEALSLHLVVRHHIHGESRSTRPFGPRCV